MDLIGFCDCATVVKLVCVLGVRTRIQPVVPR